MTQTTELVEIGTSVAPVAVVLDDSPGQVDELIRRMRDAGFVVEHKEDAAAAEEWLRENIADIVLVDVSLLSDGDVTGIEFGTTCNQVAPEAARICISREAVVQMHPTDLLSALNLEQHGASFFRIFEAFGEKTNPQQILDIVAFIQRELCRANTALVFCEMGFAERLPSILEERLGTARGVNTPQLQRQFVQTVRKLAQRASMPEPSRVTLNQIGRGRSRTLVFAMEASYGQLNYVGRSIIKIGDRELVAQEREAYARYVPLFVNHGNYPFLESVAESRDIAGIAYGHLGVHDTGSLPPTLSDLFWSLPEPDVETCASNVFALLLAQEGVDPKRAETIKQAYERRFRFLTKIDDLHARCRSAFKRLGGVIEITEDGFQDATEIGAFDQVGLPLEGLHGDGVAYPGYSECVVHGDLHCDNIVFPAANTERPFLIDFAHMGPQHIFLDYVVLEVSVRRQLGRALAKEAVAGHSERDFLLAALRFEKCLLKHAAGETYVDPEMSEQFGRLASFAKLIREKAAVRAGNEQHSNYFAGLGMACLGTLGLPGDDKASKLQRSWAVLCAAIQLHLANANSDGSQLWGPEKATASRDDRIALFVADTENRLGMNLASELAELRGRMDYGMDELQKVVARIEPMLVEIASAVPKTARRLEEIAERMPLGGEEAVRGKLVAQLGVGLLAVQLEKDIAIPEGLSNRIRELRKLLRRERIR